MVPLKIRQNHQDAKIAKIIENFFEILASLAPWQFHRTLSGTIG